MRWPIHRTIGIALIVAGLAPLAWVLFMLHLHNWQPLKIPVALTPGQFRSPEFMTDRNGRYLVSLLFDKHSDIAHQQCLMGITVDPNCEQKRGLVEFEWQVVNDENMVQSGSYKPLSFSGSEVTFAVFHGKRGGHQSIVLNIKRDSGELNTAHPTLVVQAGPEYLEPGGPPFTLSQNRGGRGPSFASFAKDGVIPGSWSQRPRNVVLRDANATSLLFSTAFHRNIRHSCDM